MLSDTDRGARNSLLALSGYGLMIAAAVVLFLLIRGYGETLSAPAAADARETVVSGAPTYTSRPLLHLLLALGCVILLGKILGRLCRYVGQPPVIGEVLAGICLGPSVLGLVAPEVGRFVLPDSVAPALSVVAQIGVILYMFVVGLELNAGILRKHGHATLAISHASIIVPFVLGALLALWHYPMLSTSNWPFTAFALFLSVSMSVTAFGVLARILTDRHMQHSPLGVMALACAATDDVSAWCLLALVVGVAEARIDAAIVVALLTVAYIVVMFAAVRPLAARLLPRWCPGDLTPAVLAALLTGALATTVATGPILGLLAPKSASLAGKTPDTALR